MEKGVVGVPLLIGKLFRRELSFLPLDLNTSPPYNQLKNLVGLQRGQEGTPAVTVFYVVEASLE